MILLIERFLKTFIFLYLPIIALVGSFAKKRTFYRGMLRPLLGTASLFTKFLFTIFLPLDPPLPTSKMMDFLLNFY